MSETYDIVGFADEEEPLYTVLASFSSLEEAQEAFERLDPCAQIALLEEQLSPALSEEQYRILAHYLDSHPWYKYDVRGVRLPSGEIIV